MKPAGGTPRPVEDEADALRRLRTAFLRLQGALHDDITGLPTYHALLDRLEAHGGGRRLAVLVLDFPHAGRVEATAGWEAGDRFLAGVAAYLKALLGRVLPRSSVLALDGVYAPAFVLFVREAAGGADLTADLLASLTASLALHLKARLREAPWAALERPDFSLGAAFVATEAAARFERRVHQAIGAARGAAADDAARVHGARTLALRRILREERLTTHYQPIVDMDQGTIMGYEALARGLEDSPLRIPDALFGGTDADGLASELDALCRRQAVRNARGFDPGKKLFLNALPETLGAPGYADAGFDRVLEETSLQPRQVVLEITERAAIDDYETFGRHLDGLRRRGFLVALDDVGTGHSSLQRLSEVQADFLKIDIALIKGIDRSLIKQDLLRSLLHVAGRSGARLIAEGIETEEEYRAVRGCGVRYGQGYYFAHPGPGFPELRQPGARPA